MTPVAPQQLPIIEDIASVRDQAEEILRASRDHGTAIGLIGDDEEVWRHLGADEQHENWYELDLDLRGIDFFGPEAIAC